MSNTPYSFKSYKVPNILALYAKALTLGTTLSLVSCATIAKHYPERCNTRAYVQQNVLDFISARYSLNSPVRVAVIPFSVPANLTSGSSNRVGVENQLAHAIHALFLEKGELPIVEVLNRQDWPQKKEEFFTGNFGAISSAREAGYDIALVGYVDQIHGTSELTAYAKLIDLESGITIWYGRLDAISVQPMMQTTLAKLGLVKRMPTIPPTADLVDRLAGCIVDSVMYDEAQEL